MFAGSGEIGVETYRALADSRHELVGAITQPDKPAGRRMEPRPSPVKLASAGLFHPLFQPDSINAPSVLDQVRYLAPDVLVVFAYGQILKRELLGIPRFGCLNLHASLLPRHRGASCIQAAIRSGDRETGMTVMWMAEGLDTGDIVRQVRVGIGRRETAGSLHDKLAAEAPGLLLRTLDEIEAGKSPRTAQNDALATYAPRLKKSDGWIDWSRPQMEIDRHIRAMNPWPAAFSRVEDVRPERSVKVFGTIVSRRARGCPGEVLRVDRHGVLVAAGEGGLLLRDLQWEGRNRLDAADFANGSPLKPGMRLV